MSCTVALATDYVTNTASGSYQDYRGTFTPPAGCPGPWAKVVLNFTGRESGRQYDRAGDVRFGGARIFFTSTPEPDPDGITWHAQKDVTEYTPSADHFLLPAQATAGENVTVSDTAESNPVFSSTLADSTDGSGVLSEYDNGQYRLANGADRQTYDDRDSTGVCYQHRVSAAQGYVTSDGLDTTC